MSNILKIFIVYVFVKLWFMGTGEKGEKVTQDVEKILKSIKQYKLVSYIVVVAVILIGVGSFTDSLDKIIQFSHKYMFRQTVSDTGKQQIIFKKSEIQKLQNSYHVMLTFTLSKNEAPGWVDFTATIPNTNQGQIVKFRLIPDHIHTGISEVVSGDGKHASIRYQPLGVFDIRLELEVSMPTTVFIEGSHQLESFSIDIP